MRFFFFFFFSPRRTWGDSECSFIVSDIIYIWCHEVLLYMLFFLHNLLWYQSILAISKKTISQFSLCSYEDSLGFLSEWNTSLMKLEDMPFLSIPYFVWSQLTYQNNVLKLKTLKFLKPKSWEEITIGQFTLIRWQTKSYDQFSHFWQELRPKTLIRDGKKIDFLIRPFNRIKF